jgi:hypothetical protein
VKTFRQLILFLNLAALLAGCGYSLTNRNSVIKRGQTIDVRMFANRTYQPNIEADLRLAFVNELVSRGEKVSGNLSDLVVSGEIVSLGVDASAFSGIDQAMYYTVSVVVQAQLTDRRSGKIVWKGTEITRQGYPANTDLALQRNSHVAAVSAACATAARLIVVKMNQSF